MDICVVGTSPGVDKDAVRVKWCWRRGHGGTSLGFLLSRFSQHSLRIVQKRPRQLWGS